VKGPIRGPPKKRPTESTGREVKGIFFAGRDAATTKILAWAPRRFDGPQGTEATAGGDDAPNTCTGNLQERDDILEDVGYEQRCLPRECGARCRPAGIKVAAPHSICFHVPAKKGASRDTPHREGDPFRHLKY